jgi:hypothetical protein
MAKILEVIDNSVTFSWIKMCSVCGELFMFNSAAIGINKKIRHTLYAQTKRRIRRMLRCE